MYFENRLRLEINERSTILTKIKFGLIRIINFSNDLKFGLIRIINFSNDLKMNRVMVMVFIATFNMSRIQTRIVFSVIGTDCIGYGFGFMVFNATFNNIFAISWQSVLLVEETGVPGENH